MREDRLISQGGEEIVEIRYVCPLELLTGLPETAPNII